MTSSLDANSREQFSEITIVEAGHPVSRGMAKDFAIGNASAQRWRGTHRLWVGLPVIINATGSDSDLAGDLDPSPGSPLSSSYLSLRYHHEVGHSSIQVSRHG